MPNQLREARPLVRVVAQLGDRPESVLSDPRPVHCLGHSHDPLLNLGDQAEEPHDLRHPGPGDSLPPRDLSLGRDLADFELTTPLLGLPEELDRPRRPGLPGWLGGPSGLGGHVHDSVGRDPPRQGANAPVLERPLGPQGNLDGLFVELGLGNAVVADRGDVDDPKPDLRRALPAGSQPVTLGDP